jgi:hypothetical protein
VQAEYLTDGARVVEQQRTIHNRGRTAQGRHTMGNVKSNSSTKPKYARLWGG